MPSPGRSGANRLAAVQGAYFAATGVWPLVHMKSFEAVTGNKAEHWLVKTVGVLVTSIGATLLDAARRGKVSRDVAMVAATSAAGLAAIDLVYGGIGRIRRVYLVDGVAQLAILGLWTRLGPTCREQPSR
jgi:hypothetical protein